MEATDRTALRELAHREDDGVEVTLIWNAADDALTVVVKDSRTGEVFELMPDTRQALDAFYHPFAFAHANGHGGRRAT